MKLLSWHGIRRVGKAGNGGGGGRRWCGGEEGIGIGVLAEKLRSCFWFVCPFGNVDAENSKGVMNSRECIENGGRRSHLLNT